MSVRTNSSATRVVYRLICLVVIGALAGCAPKLPPEGMSSEDLDTCDENAWEDDALSANYDLLIGTRPYLALPGDVDLWSPISGSILPYGEAVLIKFDMPGATDGVLFRNYRVVVTSINGTNLQWVGNQWAVVNMSSYSLQVTWTPPGSGKYIINVFLRNLETLDWLLGNPTNYAQELEKTYTMGGIGGIHAGPFSAAHVCVQIDVPHAGDLVPPQAGTVLPMQNITTLMPSVTKTPTLIPSTSTATATYTPIPPTPIPPTPIPPTEVPPTAVVSCSSFTDQRLCEVNNGCKWSPPPSGGPAVCMDK